MAENKKRMTSAILLSVLSVFYDIGGLRTTVTFCDIKSDGLTFIQSFETFTLNCGIVYKYISSFISCDESIPLFGIEPLYFACCHFGSPILCIPELSHIFSNYFEYIEKIITLFPCMQVDETA